MFHRNNPRDSVRAQMQRAMEKAERKAAARRRRMAKKLGYDVRPNPRGRRLAHVPPGRLEHELRRQGHHGEVIEIEDVMVGDRPITVAWVEDLGRGGPGWRRVNATLLTRHDQVDLRVGPREKRPRRNPKKPGIYMEFRRGYTRMDDAELAELAQEAASTSVAPYDALYLGQPTVRVERVEGSPALLLRLSWENMDLALDHPQAHLRVEPTVDAIVAALRPQNFKLRGTYRVGTRSDVRTRQASMRSYGIDADPAAIHGPSKSTDRHRKKGRDKRERRRFRRLRSEVLDGFVANPSEDPNDWHRDQFRAQVQGIYESLTAQASGRLTKKKKRALLSQAFAIATKQGQRHGYLKPGTQEPTAKGLALAAARSGASTKLIRRQLQAAGVTGRELTHVMKLVDKHASKGRSYHAQNMREYEDTLDDVRKGRARGPRRSSRKRASGKGYTVAERDGRTVYEFPDGKWFYTRSKANKYAKRVA